MNLPPVYDLLPVRSAVRDVYRFLKLREFPVLPGEHSEVLLPEEHIPNNPPAVVLLSSQWLRLRLRYRALWCCLRRTCRGLIYRLRLYLGYCRLSDKDYPWLRKQIYLLRTKMKGNNMIFLFLTHQKTKNHL